jgi:hypothetical protein
MNIQSCTLRAPMVRRAALLAAVSATALVSLSVQAAVIDSGPVSIPIPANIDGIYFNMLTGTGGPSGTGTPGWDVNLYQTGTPAGLYFFWPSAPANSSGGVASAATGGTYTALAAGASVAPASIFSLASGGGGPASFANFWVTGDQTLGLRFFNETTSAINYGCITIRTTAPAGFPATIVRFVYENNGTAITVAPPGPVTTPPGLAFTPATGSTVGFTGGTTIGSTGNGSITVALGTPVGAGMGTGATTTLNCTPPTAPFTGFGQTITAVGNGAVSGTTLSGTCTLGATASTQILTCNENRGGTANARTWTLSCPAAVVPVTSVPASGSTVTLSRPIGSAAATANIVFNNPGTAASPLTCTITGPGAASFSTTNPNPTVPAGGSVTVPVTYNSTTVGSASATLTCTGAQTFTFTINGTTGAATPASIPVFHGKGLWVMLVLMFGFGLATLLVRRN